MKIVKSCAMCKYYSLRPDENPCVACMYNNAIRGSEEKSSRFVGNGKYHDYVDAVGKFNQMIEQYGATIKDALIQFNKAGFGVADVCNELTALFDLPDEWWF